MPSPPPSRVLPLRFLPWLVAIAFFMGALDGTILNTAVPTMARELGVTDLSMKSVLAVYALSLALFIPVSGWAADRFGTRRIFALAIGLFTVGSVLCGLSRSVPQLIGCRVIQGIGGAMMLPVGRAVLVRAFPKAELVRAMSFVSIPTLMGPLIGPALGGVIVSTLGWEYLFFVNIPIGIVGVVLTLIYLPDFHDDPSEAFDWRGFALFGGGIALLSWVLEVFGEHKVPIGVLAICVFVALGLLVAYGRHAQRLAAPLLDIRLLKIPTFRIAVVGGFVARLGIGGAPFLLPLLYQSGLGFSPVKSGLLVAPQALGAMASKFFVQQALKRFGYRRLLVGNTLLLGGMLMLFATIGVGTPLWLIGAQSALYGILMSTQFTAINTLSYADIEGPRASDASALASTGQQLSISFGVAIAGLISASFVTSPQRELIISGLHYGLLVLGGLTLASTAAFMLLRSTDGQNLSGNAGDAPDPDEAPAPVHGFAQS